MIAGDIIDNVVVGAGVIGMMIARELAERQSTALVLDRTLVGCGASRFSAGLHIPVGRNPRLRDMAATSETAYRALTDADGTFPTEEIDLVWVSSEANFKKDLATFTEDASPTTSSRSAGATIGPLATRPDSRLIEAKGARFTDVGCLVERLSASLRRSSFVEVWEGTQLTAFEPHEKLVALHLADGRTISTRRLFLAPGPWALESPYAAQSRRWGIRIKKIVCMHIDVVPNEKDCVWYFSEDDAFMLPVKHRNHWLLCFTVDVWNVEPIIGSFSITEAERAQANAILAKFFPHLLPHCNSGRVFCDAYSTEREPMIKALDDAPNIIFAGAANGSGYRFAPAIACQAVCLANEI
uniref:FAD dependent oxidoreductase family protein n=1 Tax=Rhizobium rhizogenes TaxID=359 RepID=A0A7S4ZSC9_RHIRH|nr:FAD-binding oxidoreductase [Rhizobium rhizogenes]QCL09179.1 FAD dependent oxidoreductase family protein [Rhizobium rhizogenes]QCL09813.1 FAD dependent oxidoreductase family protein [Rhizobium rhizogenes]